MLVMTKICPRCGKEFVPAPQHVYKIDGNLYCSYTCHLHEVTEREEKKRKKAEETLERRRFNQKLRRIVNARAVLKCDLDGNVVERYPSQREAARQEGVAHNTIYKWIICGKNDKNIWKYEDAIGAEK